MNHKFDNNGNPVVKPTGCWLCKHLEYAEKDSYESCSNEGWYCNEEKADDFITFPCKRKLKCFEDSLRDDNQRLDCMEDN